MSSPKVKVLYLVGKGRSGGTFLNTLLGQIEGFFAPGALERLWTWGLQERWLCGCERPVPDCPFWQEVLGRALDRDRDPDIPTIAAWQRRVMSWWAIPRMLGQPTRPRWKTLRRYVDVAGRVYRAVAETAGARVVVESMRWPASPTALGMVPGVDSYVLHLVRDPRAVIYSWRRREKRWVDRPGSPEMDRFGPLFSVASWWARNFLAQITGFRRGPRRYARYRYEDFIADPAGSLRAICEWLGEPDPDLSFISESRADIAPLHTVAGNPNRFRRGPVEIRPDDEWVTRQPAGDRIVGTILSMPLLQLYRYPVRPDGRKKESIRGDLPQ